MTIQVTPNLVSREEVLLREAYINNRELRVSVTNLWSGYNGQSIELELMPVSDPIDVDLRRAVSSLSKKIHSTEQMRSLVLSVSKNLARAIEVSDKVSLRQCVKRLQEIAE